LDELNKGETSDMEVILNEYQEISLDAFEKFINIFDFIEMKKSVKTRHLRTVYLSVHNKFWSFAFNSSEKILKKSI
jgi:hypothetical protein